ncbi:immunoglobulin superfamily member 8 [Pleurodeles waltl]|uniref:immunoglobulin superfamily member 8 n=1 Tax=Pleurodeles waltl TaxID=8319 RepID=UPI003709AC6D
MEALRRLQFYWLMSAIMVICQAREVRVPQGPLYRVEGTAISIPCNVSQYEGASRQDFEWFLYRPANPDISIGIISTKDPNFSYAVFEPRVKSGEVYIHRVTGDSVELRIKQLRAEDDGVYECYTPTTDTVYLGTYSRKVIIKVIPDVLQVSPSLLKGRQLLTSPLTLNTPESKEVQLRCTASTESRQHTHLSVSFGFSSPVAPVGLQNLQEIIAVRHDFSIQGADGSSTYADRYQKGELRVEKSGGDKYKMVISRAQPEDAGTYHCSVGEWIQDPDGSWKKIVEKRSVLAQLNVQKIANQMVVTAGAQDTRVRSGDALELTCNVTDVASPLPDVVYSVEWEMTSDKVPRGQIVAGLSTDGVVSLGSGYANSDVGKRHISLEKMPPLPGCYRLRIHSAQPGDLGAYTCRVKAFVKYPNLSLKEVASKKSEGLKVYMKSEAVVVGAYSWMAAHSLYRGDTAEILCNISIETTQNVHIAVSWWAELEGEPKPPAKLLASLNRDGVAELGSRTPEGEVSTDKVGVMCYRLRIHGIQHSDEGQYHCAVTAWVQYPDRSWYNAASVKSNSVLVYPYALAMDLLFLPLIVGISSALLVGIAVLSTVTCCYMRRLRNRKR